jgi:hypothetical protein
MGKARHAKSDTLLTRSTAKHQKGNPKRKTETVIILELNQTTEELPTLKQ